MAEQFKPHYADDVDRTDPDAPQTPTQLTTGPNGEPNPGMFFAGGQPINQELGGIEPSEEIASEEDKTDAPAEGDNA